MPEAPQDRDDLVIAISDQVRSLALLSEHIGHAFAASQGLHPTDFRALGLIYEHERSGIPLTARALARAMNLSPGAVTYSVDRLEASGHVTRERDASDGRRVVLRFAPQGREVAAGFFGPLGIAHSVALRPFSDDELRVCLSFITNVTEAMASFGETPADR